MHVQIIQIKIMLCSKVILNQLVLKLFLLRFLKSVWKKCRFTPHWNDDLKKIIEQAWTMIDLSKWACKITIVQIRSSGLLKIAAGSHSPFCQIWRIFLPLYHRPGPCKSPCRKIFILMILHAQIAHLLNSQCLLGRRNLGRVKTEFRLIT